MKRPRLQGRLQDNDLGTFRQQHREPQRQAAPGQQLGQAQTLRAEHARRIETANDRRVRSAPSQPRTVGLEFSERDRSAVVLVGKLDLYDLSLIELVARQPSVLVRIGGSELR